MPPESPALQGQDAVALPGSRAQRPRCPPPPPRPGPSGRLRLGSREERTLPGTHTRPQTAPPRPPPSGLGPRGPALERTADGTETAVWGNGSVSPEHETQNAAWEPPTPSNLPGQPGLRTGTAGSGDGPGRAVRPEWGWWGHHEPAGCAPLCRPQGSGSGDLGKGNFPKSRRSRDDQGHQQASSPPWWVLSVC